MKKLISLVMFVGVVFLFSGCSTKSAMPGRSWFKHEYKYDKREAIKEIIRFKQKGDRLEIHIDVKSKVPEYSYNKVRYIYYDGFKKKRDYRRENERATGNYKFTTLHNDYKGTLILQKGDSKPEYINMKKGYYQYFSLKKYILSLPSKPTSITIKAKTDSAQNTFFISEEDLENMNIKNETWEMDDFLLELGQ